MGSTLLEIASKRHSVYVLGKNPPLGQDELVALIEGAVETAPSAYNSQGSRVLLLRGLSHTKFWEKVLEIKVASASSPDSLARAKAKIGGFMAAAGTICFFEDQATIRAMQERYPGAKDSFRDWSLESAGMLQILVWTALAERGVGASLQHYNPLIDEWLTAHANLPPDWKLLAQMPYGSIMGPAEPKEKKPASERMRMIG